MTPKQTALAALTAVPDDTTWDAIFAAIDAVAPRHTPEQLAEWQRRIADYKSGKTKGIPAEEVHLELIEKLEARRVSV